MSPTPTELRTERLLLRRWRPDDREPFAALNADPVVMEHFVAPLSRAESDDMVDRIEDQFDREGYGLWAVEIVDTVSFAGFVGLTCGPPRSTHLRPRCRGRLAHGPSMRGARASPQRRARASLADGFDRIGLDEIVSMTSVGQHPLPPGHAEARHDHATPPTTSTTRTSRRPPIRRHVLYRRTRP